MSMTPERWQQIKVVLEDALKLRPQQRSGFLAKACSDDPALRQEVESFLTLEDEVRFAPIIGETISHYRIVGELGSGGMGVVYKAEDVRLHRFVALKFLPENLCKDRKAVQRFEREARSASSLNHPNICTIYEVEEHETQPVIVMEWLQGENLKDRIGKGPLPTDEVIDLGIQIADALEAAHIKGIIHRDIKPANIFVVGQNRVKVLDFGLAKALSNVEAAENDREEESLTMEGVVLGTSSYMSPEQVRGEDLDGRSDLFSLGVVLYELATGKRPFVRKNGITILDAILHVRPKSATALNPSLPAELDTIISKALEKNPDLRYQHASELRSDLQALAALKTLRQDTNGSISIAGMARKPRVAIPALAVLAVSGLLVGWYGRRSGQIRWAHETVIPEITRLAEKGQDDAAFVLAKKVEAILPGDQALQKLWPEVSLEISVHSEPQGAEVYMKPYRAADARWERIGRSPITHLRVPFGLLRWKVEKEGFQTAEALSYLLHKDRELEFFFEGTTLNLSLTASGTVPNGMVRIPGGEVDLHLPGMAKAVSVVNLPEYWMDRYEVTNREFKQFVDAGGYRKPEYWKQPFVENGKTLSFQQAMSRFRDKAGRPGPAAWELGNYPEGQGDYPVTGVSWYEAAAYAEFAGKNLPTAHQWQNAAWTLLASDVVPLSNFEGRGLAPVGSHQGMSPYGTYDMAGNAKEWCWNATDNKRFILGGAWNEPPYMFVDRDAQSPFDRRPTYGFRCVKEIPGTSLPKAALEPISLPFRDFSREKPVSDQVFAAFKSLYRYDAGPLDTVIDQMDDSSEYYTRQKVTFNAAYGNERMSAYVYLPKNSKPPYQTVVFFPGSDAVVQRSSKDLDLFGCDFVIKSGRALVYPIYKSHYERGDGLPYDDPDETARYRDHVIYWAKDLGRTIDYLKTRKDLNLEKLAYYGLSTGAYLGNILPAVENRIRMAVLLGGGFEVAKKMPEVDELNFAPRIKVPTLLVNGRYDHFFPLELQNVMFRFLGTPERDKRHAVLEGGHAPQYDQMEKEILDWLDKYQGPLK